MKEYIERDAVLAFADRVRYVKNEDVEAGIQGVLIFVRDELPAADVREVVKAKDVWFEGEGHCEFKCSLCGEEIKEHWGAQFKYCPYCGAEMEGEEDD